MEKIIGPRITKPYRAISEVLFEEKWHLLALFAVIFTSYLISMPKTVMLEDDGLFIMSSYFLGIAHPPGYPIHTLIGHLFSQIPIGSVASRVHAMSGFFGALGCLLITLIVMQLLKSRVAAYTAALVLAWSPVYWSQSIIAEVYTLNAFFFLLILLLLLNAVDYHNQHPTHVKEFKKTLSIKHATIAFFYGLSLTNHWPLMILGSSCYLIIAWPLLKEIATRFISIIIFFAAGLTPYLWMYLYNPPPPEYTFMGPINNLSDLWFYISRKGYSSVDSSISAGLADKIAFSGFFFKETAMQFLPLGTLFALIGFYTQWKIIGKRISYALFIGFLSTSVLLIGLLNFDFDELHRAFLRVYLMPAFAIMSIWCALGILHVISRLTPKISNVFSKQQKASYLVSAITITLIITTSARENFRHNDDWSTKYANTLFSTLEKNSVLFTDTDSTVGVIGYLHHIEKKRPDITIMNSNGQLYSNRITSPKKLTSFSRESTMHNYLRSTTQSISFTSEPDLGYGEIYNGLRYKISFDLQRGQRAFSADNIHTIEYLSNLADQKTPSSTWERIRHSEIIHNGIPLFVDLHLNKAIQHEFSTSYIESATQNLKGKLILAYTLLGYNRPNEFSGINHILAQAATQLATSDKQDKSLYYALLGKQKLMENKIDEAKDNFHASMEIWPQPIRNIAMKELENIYLSQDKENEYLQFSSSLR